MASVLIAVVIAVLLGHLAPDLAQLRRHGWLRDWARAATLWFGRLESWPGAIGVVIVVGLPVLALALLDLALRDVAYGLPSLLLGIAVLFYAWGPRDLDLDVDAIASAPDPSRRADALSALAAAPPAAGVQGADLIDAVFRAALERWFAVLFWFVLLGPAGALLYRMAQLFARDPDFAGTLPPRHPPLLERFAATLEWVPAQLMTLALAIAADFDAVARAWRDYHASRGSVFTLGNGFLYAAGRATVDADLDEDDAYVSDARVPIAEMQEAASLCWRVLLVWGVVFALLVLAGKIS